jgi:riboflavin kinase
MGEANRLDGDVRSGTGEGAAFVALGWVRAAVRATCGFDPFPGTLNVALTNPDSLARWRRILKESGLPLTAPAPDACGGRCFPVLVAGEVPGAVVVPDVTRYGEDLLEVIAPVHLRSRLGLQDGDRIQLSPLIPGKI